MRITQISVNFSETCSLGDYSNPKLSLELTAQLDATDEAEAVLVQLIAMAKQHLHEEIDKELLACGREPKYYHGPTYSVLSSSRYGIYAIVPSDCANLGNFYREKRRLPLTEALRYISTQYDSDDRTIFDCSNGDLSELLTNIETKEKLFTEVEAEFEEARKRRKEEEE